MNTNFIESLLNRLDSLLPNNRSVSPPERPELVLRNPGPVVYLLEADAFYKIGSTKDFFKRGRQIKLQLPFRTIQIHVIYTDDEVWLEKYWHNKFDAKRRNGEWFELDADDVALFCSQDEMHRPAEIAHPQLDFERNDAQPEAVSICRGTVAAEQTDHKTTLIQEVENYYRNLISLYPKRTRSLEGSRKYQFESMDAEISRLQLRRGYSETQAMQEWKRKAIMAADANARSSK